MIENFKTKLKTISRSIFFDEAMKNHTSFKIGGKADVLILPYSVDEIKDIIKLCKQENVPYMIIGNGSNMLVSDEGIEGVVIKISSNMKKCEINNTHIYAESGILLSKLSNLACRAGLSGLEFAGGIPGTLGGGIYMNAGAYGGEMKDVVVSVTYIDENGNIKIANREQLDFSYRHSIFVDTKNIILSCDMELLEGDIDKIKSEMEDYQTKRKDKQPLNMPSAGSTFKRPEGYFAAKLIDEAGLRGYCVGGAMVSEKHSGFIVNTGDATAKDVIELIKYVKQVVWDKFNIELQTEVKIIGR